MDEQLVLIQGVQSRKHQAAEVALIRLRKIHEELNSIYGSHPSQRPTIHTPADTAELLAPFMDHLDHEELWVILLDIKNRVKKLVKLYQGTISSSNVRVAEVFREAVIENAPQIIVVHNHPSGDPVPSPVIWRICQGYWLNSATGSQWTGVKRLFRNRFTLAIVFPPVTLSRVLRYAQHPFGTSPLTGSRPTGRLFA